MMKITVIITIVAATMRTKTNTPTAINTGMFGVLCPGVGVTSLVEVRTVAPVGG